MSVRGRRRRGLLLLALALASGGLAASHVGDRVRAVEARVGPLVPVLVVTRELPRGARIGPRSASLRAVPERFAPPDALVSTAELTGARTSVALAAGSYLTAGQLQASRDGRPAGALRRGERAVEVAVAGGQALSGASPGTRVDVLVSSEPRDGGGRTFVALEDVELLALRGSTGLGAAPEGSGSGSSGRPEASALATLRARPSEAVYLAAAENFARELRLVVRPPGDRRRAGRQLVTAAGL